MEPDVREKHEFVPRAVIRRPPTRLDPRGTGFRSGVDDLNACQVAELTLGYLPFALMRHDGTASDETAIYLPDTVPIDQLPGIVDAILLELALPLSAVVWRRERADTPY